MDVWVSQYELDALLGKSQARLLTSHYGGLRQFIPREPDSAHPLARLLGMRDMGALARAFGGSRITVPNGRREEPKKEEIARALEEGKSVRSVALALGVTERWVRAVASRHGTPCRQLPLPLPPWEGDWPP